MLNEIVTVAATVKHINKSFIAFQKELIIGLIFILFDAIIVM